MFCYAGFCRPPVDKARRYLRSDDADAAFPLGVTQTLDPPGPLIEGGETGAEVGRIAAVCGRTADKQWLQTTFFFLKGADSSFQRFVANVK